MKTNFQREMCGEFKPLAVFACLFLTCGCDKMYPPDESASGGTTNPNNRIEIKKLVGELKTLKVEGASFGGPFLAINYNSTTRAIVSRGEEAIPYLIDRLEHGNYSECVYSMFCLREMKVAKAKDAVQKLQEEVTQRFPGTDMTLVMQIRYYLKDVGKWN